MADITFNGMTMEFSVVEGMMDKDLKNELNASMGNPSEQELLDAYLVAHKEKFDKDFLQA